MNYRGSFTVNFDSGYESMVCAPKRNEKVSRKQMNEAGRGEIESFRCSLLWRSFGQWQMVGVQAKKKGEGGGEEEEFGVDWLFVHQHYCH